MAENNSIPEVQQDLSEILRVRREKLSALQSEGRDPFQETKFVVSIHAREIKERFDELEGQEVTIAGRLMSKRGMGKVSFCDLQDKSGRIQLYARKDEMDEEQYAAFLDLVEDTVDMVGIGVEIDYTEDGFLVQKVLSGGAALEAGLQTGDLIVAVDGVPCTPAGEEHRQLMLGEAGAKVTVTVLRDGQTKDYTLTRRAVYIPNTEISLLEGGVGYVDCNSFGADTDELLAAGLKQYDSQVDCWIIDLRDNAGGYVDSALEMIAALNGPGNYLYFEETDGQVAGYTCRSSSITRKPLILLVNDESASASELLASGVRDTNRGIVIGSRTFGKGIAQSVFDESTDPAYFDGDCLKITTARFYSAGGATTDKIGVIPTLLVDDGYTEAVAAALCGGGPDTSNLCVIPGAKPFYVDPETPDEVLSILLEALPPQTPLFYSGGPGQNYDPGTPAQASRGILAEPLPSMDTALSARGLEAVVAACVGVLRQGRA